MPSGFKRSKLTSVQRYEELIQTIPYGDDVIARVRALAKDKKILHPYIIIGLHKDLPYRYYLSLFENIYSFESLNSCIDLLIKCYFVFNLSYPKEVLNIYMFIQHFIYRIYLKSDIKVTSVVKLINSLDKNRLPCEN